jgi:hypothetical protein
MGRHKIDIEKNQNILSYVHNIPRSIYEFYLEITGYNKNIFKSGQKMIILVMLHLFSFRAHGLCHFKVLIWSKWVENGNFLPKMWVCWTFWVLEDFFYKNQKISNPQKFKMHSTLKFRFTPKIIKFCCIFLPKIAKIFQFFLCTEFLFFSILTFRQKIFSSAKKNLMIKNRFAKIISVY